MSQLTPGAHPHPVEAAMRTYFILLPLLFAASLPTILSPVPARAADTLFVSDYGEGTTGARSISEIVPNQTVTPFATGLTEPTGLAFDSSGNLYLGVEKIVNGFNQPALDKITPAGQLTTFASALSSHVEGLAFDASGNLYAATS